MPGRILTLQRQARELGRLRAGYTEPSANGGRDRPVRSKTWILTTHQRDYLDAAAEQWGGTVERWQPQGGGAEAWRLITDTDAIDAILPPGDPLSQSYEMWSRGGCQRRCDGEREQLTGQPCLCLAEFGDDFYQQSPDMVCRPHTRLNVVLPDVPDLGVWRVETKGFWAANEIAASVDLIRNATGGQVMVPVRLRIEPRQRIAQGQTKRYPVIVVEIRGATAGQILSGVIPKAEPAAIDTGAQRAAIAAAPTAPPAPDVDWYAEIAAAGTADTINALRERMRTAGVRDRTLVDAWNQRARDITATVTAVASGDPDLLWSQIVSAAPTDWGTSGLATRFREHQGVDIEDATATHLAGFLNALKAGEIQ